MNPIENVIENLSVSINKSIDRKKNNFIKNILHFSKEYTILKFIAKEDFIFSGKNACESILRKFNKLITIKWNFSDGDSVLRNQNLFFIKGRTGDIYNIYYNICILIEHLSGIASFTNYYFQEIKKKNEKIDIISPFLGVENFDPYQIKATEHGKAIKLFPLLETEKRIFYISNIIKKSINYQFLLQYIENFHDVIFLWEFDPNDEIDTINKIPISYMVFSQKEFINHFQILKSQINSNIKTIVIANISPDEVATYSELDVDYIYIKNLIYLSPSVEITIKM